MQSFLLWVDEQLSALSNCVHWTVDRVSNCFWTGENFVVIATLSSKQLVNIADRTYHTVHDVRQATGADISALTPMHITSKVLSPKK